MTVSMIEPVRFSVEELERMPEHVVINLFMAQCISTKRTLEQILSKLPDTDEYRDARQNIEHAKCDMDDMIDAARVRLQETLPPRLPRKRRQKR
jgi:hypothetical protein